MINNMSPYCVRSRAKNLCNLSFELWKEVTNLAYALGRCIRSRLYKGKTNSRQRQQCRERAMDDCRQSWLCVCRANVPLSLPTSPNPNLNPCPLNYADCIILLFSCAVLTAKVITSEYKDKTLKLISKYRLGKPPVLVQVLTLFCIILYYIV